MQCSKTHLKDKYLILFLFSCHSLLPLKRTVAMSVTRASLLWVIDTGKSIDLPCMMFMSLRVAYNSSNRRGSVPFTVFLTELFKRHGIHIPVDLIRIEPEKAVDRYSLTQFEGQRKKRRFEAIASEEPLIAMAELKEAITSLRMEFDTCITTLEEQSGCHTTMFQKIKGMLIWMQSKDDDDDEDDE